MNKPSINDKVFLQYGAMCGSDTAVVVEKEETRWGTTWAIQLENGSYDSIQSYVGTTDSLGHGANQIGAYLIVD